MEKAQSYYKETEKHYKNKLFDLLREIDEATNTEGRFIGNYKIESDKSFDDLFTTSNSCL